MKTQTKQQTGKIGEVTQLQQACIRKIEESCNGKLMNTKLTQQRGIGEN